ncbi:MAG: SHOCT domain-containing protein [Actinobacteria bacterium]|nr:SHOCT domain-containing protein [Actinomycetota bacterium]
MSGYVFVVLAIIFVVVLFGMIFYGASTLMRRLNEQLREDKREPSKKALGELESRYARGEIDRVEFESKLRDIEKAPREDEERDDK